eukprot:g3234.t1
MVLTAFVGCCGTCYALRDLRANHDGVITTDDYHVGKHKGTFRCFVVSVFVLSIVHLLFAFVSLDSAGHLEFLHGSKSSTKAHIVDLRHKTARTVHADYAEKLVGFEDPGWIGTQNHFKCCGFDSIHPQMMTGRHCNYPDGADVLAMKDGTPCTTEGNGCRKYKGGTLHSSSTYCAVRFSQLFVLSGWIAAGLAFFEILALVAACCLYCGASTSEDVHRLPRDFASDNRVVQMTPDPIPVGSALEY